MKQRFEVIVYHEQPHKEPKIVTIFYVWIEMSENGRTGRDEFVYARVRESERV